MPKFWGKQIFTHRRFPEVGQKQKTERKERKRKRERMNDGDNNGQAMHGTRKHSWRTQAAWANFFLHISSSYAKILGEKLFRTWEIPRSGSKAEDGERKKKRERGAKVGENNGQATHGARKHAWRTQAAWAN